MSVVWLIPVQDRVQESMGPAGVPVGALEAKLAELAELLEGTFPTAGTIVVTGRVSGYTNNADKHVLHVEVVEQDRSVARVVKIGMVDDLTRELAAWQTSERPSNDRGRVFMELRGGKPAGSPEQYETLVYEDASQTLRAAEVASLEDVVLRCVRWGTPTTGSVLAVLNQVFAEMTDRLYRRAWSQPPDAHVADYWKHRLEPGQQQWRNLYAEAGQACDAVLNSICSDDEFLDPCECLSVVLENPERMPASMRGCSHGDLHGRNVLVGCVDGEALWPAVFDYEDMSRDGFPAWDFAKLETEIKVRALQEVYQGDEQSYMKSVIEFERRLEAETERLNNLGIDDWRDPADHSTAEKRLLAILLGIRRQARQSLELIHGLNRRWLHELYFMLATYGVYAGRFRTYHRRDDLTCFVCAGTAAARYAWSHPDLLIRASVAESTAASAIADADPSVRLQTDVRLSHYPEFAFARRFSRSRSSEFVQASIEILRELAEQFPGASEIRQELALAHLEQFHLTQDPVHQDQGERVLLELEMVSSVIHPETRCRWGRLWKDRGDPLFDADIRDPFATSCYRKAINYYQQACSQDDRNYYPAINVATLLLLLGEPDASQIKARDVLELLTDAPLNADEESIWIQATIGEAHLLMGNGKQSTGAYRSAILHPRCQAHHHKSMAMQVRRILRVSPQPLFDEDSLFRNNSIVYG